MCYEDDMIDLEAGEAKPETKTKEEIEKEFWDNA